ncbi:MAG: Flp pilus assembly complex ATPase component TadA, partial [Pedosphaera parvula]|nr:Flp pilus assembly complex ATPase component TadA [Pedosphaera parvula]
MAPVKSFGERIADAMVEDGLLTTKQVEELVEVQKKEGTRLLKLLIDKSYVTDVDMMVSMGRVLNVPPVNLARIGIAADVAGLIPKELATNHKVLPVSRLDNKLFLAMADPLNVLALDDVKRITKLEVQPMITSEKAILDKINNLETKGASMEDIIQDAEKQAQLEAEAEGAELIAEASEDMDAGALEAAGEEAPVIKLANLILVTAIKDRASDIHIEPFEKMVRLRYRVDGALVDATPPPKNLQMALTSRLKIMASLDISERRLPQDGRMRMKVGGRDIDLRVSFMPVVHGE